MNVFQKWCVDNCMKLNLEHKFTLKWELLNSVDVYNYPGLLLDKNVIWSLLFARVKKVVY